MSSNNCTKKSEEIINFVTWRMDNMPDYKDWVMSMLRAWGAMLNEANNQRSLLPFASLALAHLGVGLTATYVIEGASPEEAIKKAKEELCAVYMASLELLDRAFQQGKIMEIIEESMKEAEDAVQSEGIDSIKEGGES
ncbi:hypothetical protein Pyrde_0398 [Pyrodictium delaneyi]|uniref:Pterin-binding domain-containing protein n=3 Tax=Pyrodictium delaneyi TaxID=1273541 RepID=A0A0P0N2B4_9CREN|nr:hypothetical protein [Pyrodictium delaneyi]ALL00448.1 hypothetical protein Pyrde_0398 [Pyrodictium delaneyi]